MIYFFEKWAIKKIFEPVYFIFNIKFRINEIDVLCSFMSLPDCVLPGGKPVSVLLDSLKSQRAKGPCVRCSIKKRPHISQSIIYKQRLVSKRSAFKSAYLKIISFKNRNI